jgi:hypothetical protein
MLCHQHKCIYIHIPKSAGQSIHQVFARRLGYYVKRNAPLLLNRNKNPQLGPPALGHLMASEYVKCGHISQELFDSYFKFSFVRNPWDRIVSEYKYRGHARKYDFKEFLFGHLPKKRWADTYYHILPQYDFLHDHNGKLLVDIVGRFENLQSDFDEVCRRLNIPLTKIPHRNSTFSGLRIPRSIMGAVRMAKDLVSIKQRKNTFSNYRDYYDNESRQFVAELYRKDIETFGYSFLGDADSRKVVAPQSSVKGE